MTINLALEYIPKRMCELNIHSYHLRFRHLHLRPGEQREITSHTQLFYLVEPPGDIRVESDVGLFDLTETLTGELQYEHRGQLTITNLSAFFNHVRFIQVIPKI